MMLRPNADPKPTLCIVIKFLLAIGGIPWLPKTACETGRIPSSNDWPMSSATGSSTAGSSTRCA